ncbi:hypothetical protein ENUP19_0018G0006 [Entamoeba nuttalli]|uniref:WH2 motif domain contaning protein n=2 Tax=Entamoeba nuttalli TaxID=412467 RepID=K2GEE0_ENTNP|nr:WH2 motif domain contaning protein [Entamoeba nuttalli P19]EKE40976.1 WH2 motif domain contaning protein [Entamoeba nuttalli P19]|eukprot:XP_008856689.1 WH2 motif domain contaning protein [Entamoeba nuttalli P19]
MSIQQVLENLQINNDTNVNGRQLKISMINLFKFISSQIKEVQEEDNKKQANLVKTLQVVIKEVDTIKKVQQETQNKIEVMANVIRKMSDKINESKGITSPNMSSLQKSCGCEENRKIILDMKKKLGEINNIVDEVKESYKELKNQVRTTNSNIASIKEELNTCKSLTNSNPQEIKHPREKNVAPVSTFNVPQSPQACVQPPPPPPIDNSKVPSVSSISTSGRGDLLSQIQRGKKLKKTTVNDRSRPMISKEQQSPTTPHYPTNPLMAAIAARANRGGSSMKNTRGTPQRKW